MRDKWLGSTKSRASGNWRSSSGVQELKCSACCLTQIDRGADVQTVDARSPFK